MTYQATITARKEVPMSKLKIEHGASKVHLVQLKTNIEDGISNDIDLMCQWSENDRKYIINELLRFALTQEEDFLMFKAGPGANRATRAGAAKPVPAPTKPLPAAAPKIDPTSSTQS
jgi:hypothetical protein